MRAKRQLLDAAGEQRKAADRAPRRRHRARKAAGQRVFRLTLSPFDIADLLYRQGELDDPDHCSFEESRRGWSSGSR